MRLLWKMFLFFPKISLSESVAAPNLVKFTRESSSVTLEWRYNEDDEVHPAFITGYLVTVQEVQQDALAGCAKEKLPNFLFFSVFFPVFFLKLKQNVVEFKSKAQTLPSVGIKLIRSPDLLNVSVLDPRRKSVTVDSLQPSRDYVLSVSALSVQGPGQATSITIRARADCELRHGRGRCYGDVIRAV